MSLDARTLEPPTLETLSGSAPEAEEGRPAPRGRGIEAFTDLPISLGVRAAGWAMRAAGPSAAYAAAGALGLAWHALLPSRRRVARRNLEIAFGGSLDAAGRRRIARASYRHALATAADAFLAERWAGPERWREVIASDPGLDAVLAGPRPRGLVILSTHLGDWEMARWLLAVRGVPTAVVARSIRNPHLDRMVTGLRCRRGGIVIPKRGGLRRLLAALRSGAVVGLLPDQSGPPGEVHEEFFGAAAATHVQYARLLARLRPAVACVACVREGFAFRFRILFRDLTPVLDGPGVPGSAAERGRALVRAYLRTIEGWIRERPEQYLWMHRRWKHRPPGFPDLYTHLGDPIDPSLLERSARQDT